MRTIGRPPRIAVLAVRAASDHACLIMLVLGADMDGAGVELVRFR